MHQPDGETAPDTRLVTLNRRGRTSLELNEYSRAFVDYLGPGSGPALDIGAAYGVATIPALRKGVAVIANDIEPGHLRILEENTPESDRGRLTLLVGRFPDELDFPDASLGAIHAANILNFLTGEAIERGARKMYRWLRQGGLVFTISGTPYAGNIREFIPVYEGRRDAGERWPGEAYNLQNYSSHRTVGELPAFLHLLDDHVLTRVFVESGFRVNKVEMFLRKNLPAYLAYDGRENVGLIATKPSS
jgi:SAM-dependent methyltransferase